MYPGRFFIPNYSYTMPIKSPGLFSRIFGGIRGFNWSGLLTNANKTLNVVNQTIPLIRQTGPMFNNLRSMMHLARAFNSETGTINNKIINNQISNNNSNNNNNILPSKELTHNILEQSSESPSFFI